ncbi:MAG: metal ABC transporter permease [Rhodospirillales bacterium]|nr:metal ABC transporter permease [Rhodospirillales bacterium]
MDDFLIRAVLAGLGVAAVAAPLGVFVVWRRMAYFGDTMAHSALLGVALGVLLGINLDFGVFVVCVATALLLVGLQRRRQLADDTLLGILSHGTLSIGVIAVTFLESLRLDLISYLFGDILAVSVADLAWIYGGGALVLGVLGVIWRPLLASVVHEELARVEGVPVLAVRLAFMALIAVLIAVAMKVVGILLVTSLLIIPAAAARRFARTPEAMALLAALAGVLAVVLGLAGSLAWDLPSGPAIVAAAALLFALASFSALLRPRG